MATANLDRMKKKLPERLAQVRGEGDAPEDLLLKSPVILLCGAGWVVATLWSLPLPW